MDFFGFTLKRKREEDQPKSVVSPTNDDGSIVVNGRSNSAVYGDSYSLSFDPEGQIKTEIELIRRYRELARTTEVSEAIEDIVNEAINVEDDQKTVELNLDDLKYSDSIKKKINEAFEDILDILDFNEVGYEIFEKWYIDGKIYYQILFDGDKPKNGIKELRPIDPRKIKKIKKLNKEKLPSGLEVVKSIEEYFIYNDKGFSEGTTIGIKLTPDSVILCTSGIIDHQSNLILSHLQKAVKPANQLRMLEDAVVIQRLTKAPERRVFYVDVGNLPKGKAEQYVQDMMTKFKNKLTYDAQTGELSDSKKHLSMIEDYWMPRRSNGKSTEITTLPGLQNQGSLDDLQMFKDKLYHSLNVPVSRMKPDETFNLGRSNEISRDEIKFSKFISKLRTKFNGLFYDALKVQLISKGVINLDDWDEIRPNIKFKYSKDNHFAEMKEGEILSNRLQILQMIDPYVNRYVDKEYVQKKVLRMDDEEITEMDKRIEEQKAKEAPPEDPNQLTPEDMQAQQMQNDQEAHDQDMKQSAEMHNAKLNQMKAKK